MRNMATVLLLLMGVAFPYVVGYHLDPVKAQWSGWALGDENHGVSQSVTCSFDSLSYVELFAGAKGSGGVYRAGAWQDGAEVMWSNGTQVQNESWVKFENWNTQVAFTKGKELTIKFTRSGSDSIQYYYQGGNPALSDPYSWGWMRVGGTAIEAA